MIKLARICIAAALWLSSGAALADNLVQNPGFENAGAGWGSERFTFISDPLWARTDSGSALLGLCSNIICIDELDRGAYVDQVLATRPGELYDLSFWVRSYIGVTRISVFWDGVELLRTPTPNGPMVQYTFSALAASGAATLLQVHGSNSLHRHMSFDDFAVVQVAAPPVGQVPANEVAEPAMPALLLAAIGALVFFRRRGK